MGKIQVQKVLDHADLLSRQEKKDWLGMNLLRKERKLAKQGDGYHMANPLREFQGMRVGVIQEYSSQKATSDPSQKGSEGLLG